MNDFDRERTLAYYGPDHHISRIPNGSVVSVNGLPGNVIVRGAQYEESGRVWIKVEAEHYEGWVDGSKLRPAQ